MASLLTYRVGDADMGRIQPTTRSIVTNDEPTPASLRTLAVVPFALTDGITMLLNVDNGPTLEAVLDASSFADITAATAAEVAAELALQLGVIGSTDAGQVVITSPTSGLLSSLEIRGGQAQQVLLFETGRAQGTQGAFTFLLGHEREGVREVLAAGDRVEISQTALYNDNQYIRLHGVAEFRDTPATHDWSFEIATGAFTQVLNRSAATANYQQVDLSEYVISTRGLAGAQGLSLGLEYTGVGEAETELPAVWIDWLEFVETPASNFFLANRNPAPLQPGIPIDVENVDGMIINTTGNAVVAGSIELYVDQQLAYQSGAFVAPFSGTVTTGTGGSGQDVSYSIDMTGYSLEGNISEYPVLVVVNAETTGGDSLEDHYRFFLADYIEPHIASITPTSVTTVLLTFDEDVLMTAADLVESALNPSNYTLTAGSAPAVPLTVTSVAQVSSDSVTLTFDTEVSMGATYSVLVSNVTDLEGNVVSNAPLSFVGYRPTPPAGRVSDLWGKIPRYNRAADTSRDLRRFILCLQDVWDHLLRLVDEWPSVWQVDLADDAFLDAMLAEMGNPFDFELSEIDKRRLIVLLGTIYSQKGTPEGIVNAVRFFCEIDVTVVPLNSVDNYWTVGTSTLGVDTFIAPGPGSPEWYSFRIDSPVLLTDEERSKILFIANYMKAAHEHIVGIREPSGTITTAGYWVLGTDSLGIGTYVGA